MIKFKNTPDQKEKEAQKALEVPKPEVVQKRKYTRHMVVASKKRSWFSIVRDILLIALVLFYFIYFGAKASQYGKKINAVREEINFAIDHPKIVKAIKTLYEAGHNGADTELNSVLGIQ
jgi:hypothetical protein